MPNIPKRNVRAIIQGSLQFAKLTNPDLGLQVLDHVIMTRWKVLPRDQCQGMHVRLCVGDSLLIRL